MTVHSVLLISFLLMLVSCRTASDYIAKGDAFAKDGKHDEAILNYRKAIQKQESLGEAHYKLALSMRSAGNAKQASAEFARAAQLMPGREDVQAAYGEVLLADYLRNASRPKALYDQLHLLSDQMLKLNPASLPALRTKGTLAIVDKKPKEAIAFLRKAYDARPHDALTVELLMQALVQDGDGAGAEAMGWETIRNNKSAIPVYSLLYKQYFLAKKNEEAERVLREKLNNNLDSPDSYIDLAAFYHTTNNVGARTQIIDQLLAKKSLSSQALLAAAGFYTTIAEYESAKKLFQEGRQAHPENKLPYLKGEISVLLVQDKKSESLQLVEAALKEFPKDLDIRTSRGFIWSESQDLAKVDAGIAELRAVIKDRPASANLHYALGQALLRKGARAEAGTAFRSALKINPRFELALYGLSELSLIDKQHGEAKRYADELLQIDPTQNKARLIRAVAQKELGNLSEATTELQQLAKEFPASTEPLLEMARLRFAENKIPEAERMFLNSYKAGQADIRPLEGLVSAYVAQNKLGDAILLLNKELLLQPDNTTLRSLHSSVALLAGDFQSARESANKLLTLKSGAIDGHLRLGDALLQSGKPTEARMEFQAARQLDPEHKQASAMIALAFEGEGNIPEAIAAYRRAILLQPENASLMNNLAFLLAERGETLDEALKMAYGATQRSRRPEFADTLGWVFLKKGSFDQAIQALRAAIKERPSQPVFRYHLGLALLKKGDKQAALGELKSALSLSPDPSTQAAIREVMSKSSL